MCIYLPDLLVRYTGLIHIPPILSPQKAYCSILSYFFPFYSKTSSSVERVGSTSVFHLHKDLSVSRLRLFAPSQHGHSFLPPESSSATHSVHSHGNEHSSINKEVTALPPTATVHSPFSHQATDRTKTICARVA